MTTTITGSSSAVVGNLALQNQEYTYSDAAFGNFLANPSAELELDLSKATLIDVIEQHARFKRRLSPNYTHLALVRNIEKLEEVFRCKIMPTQINDIFYSYFIQYMLNRGLVYSTIENYCTQIRTALRWGLRHKCPVSSTYDIFTVPKYKKAMIYLTPDQISHIYHFDIHSISNELFRQKRYSYAYLDRVRDFLVLSCSLGQRFSDMERVCRDHFDETGTIFAIVQQKTANKAVVDTTKWSIDSSVVRAILNKYDYTAPNVAGKNNYNCAIKFLLQQIGREFLKPISTENKIGGKIVKTTTPFYKLVSSHTARRTFVCYHLIQGKREIDIRKCTGHQSGRSFDIYDVRDNI